MLDGDYRSKNLTQDNSELTAREITLREAVGTDRLWAFEYRQNQQQILLSDATQALLGPKGKAFSHFLQKIHPRDRFRITHGVLRSLRRERGFSFDCLSYPLSHLPEMKLQLQGRCENTASGLIVRGFVQDISPLRTSTRVALDDRLRSLFELSAVGIVYCTIDGRILDVNETYCRMTGYDRNAVIGTPVHRFTHPDDLSQTEIERERMRRSATDQAVLEKRYLRKDGSTFWVQVSISAIHDPDGQTRHYLAIVQDIDERVKAQATLKQSEENFRLLSETLPQIVWLENTSGEVRYLNQQWEIYTGRSIESSLGKAWFDSMHPEDRPTLISDYKEAPAHTAVPSFIEAIQRLMMRDGQYRWFLSRGVPVYGDKGELTGWLGTSTDIDQQKRITQELEKARALAIAASESKGAFLANMSHEIRTPLGIILGYCELLRRPGVTSEMQSEFLNAVIRNGRELAMLIDNILDYSKIEATQMELAPKRIALVDQASALVSAFRVKAEEKGLKLLVHVSESAPRTIVTDELRFRQILTNLIGNAIKFTDQGAITLAFQGLDAKGHLVVDVEDTGCGIAEDQLDLLFKPYSQVNPSSTRRHVGTGLGLVLARLVAQALGGDVRLLQTKKHEGSTFRATINPGLLESQAMAASPDELEDESSLSGLRILLAEDAVDNQYIFSSILASEGAEVSLVENGREAVDQAMQGSYDLILMDIQMPVMDGYAATRELRKRGFSKPIIALSAHALPEDAEKSRKAGCDDHITKPVDFDRMLQVIRRHARKVQDYQI